MDNRLREVIMLLVIDIESYIYRACTACKVLKQCETDRFIWGEYYDLRKGLDYINKLIRDWQERFLTNDVILVVGDKNNWRKSYCPEYKANRLDKEKPVMYEPLFNELLNQYEIVSLPNLEADDTCRIIYEDNQNYPTRKILISIDKDFKSFPCELFDPLHNEHVVINQAQADYNLMYQLLLGDKADNYPGLSGYGEVKAKQFLDDEPRTWLDIKQLYKEAGDKSFEQQRNLATIVSLDRYNFNTGEVKLLKEIM